MPSMRPTRSVADSDEFVHMDEEFKVAIESDPPLFVLKAVWDKKRPRLVLKETIQSGSIFDDFDKVVALLHDGEPSVALVHAGNESSNAWVVITCVPEGATPASKAWWSTLDDTIMRMWPGTLAKELRVSKRSDLTMKAVADMSMQLIAQHKGAKEAKEADKGNNEAKKPDKEDNEAHEAEQGDDEGKEPDSGDGDAKEPDSGDHDAKEPDSGDDDAKEPDSASSQVLVPAWIPGAVETRHVKAICTFVEQESIKSAAELVSLWQDGVQIAGFAGSDDEKFCELIELTK